MGLKLCKANPLVGSARKLLDMSTDLTMRLFGNLPSPYRSSNWDPSRMRTEVELLPTSCSGVILISDPCTVFPTCPLTDIQVAASVTVIANIAGTILCEWSWAHVRVFLGENTKGLDGSPGGRVTCPSL